MSLEIQTAAELAIALAQKHAEQNSYHCQSARVALWDAASLYAEGKHLFAYRRAIVSLEYSAGKFSPAWRMASRAIRHPVDAACDLARIRTGSGGPL